MKKIIAAVIFCTLFMQPLAFAGNDSIDAQIMRTLYILLKLPYANSQLGESAYQQKTIVYKGICLNAFKNNATGWTGFFKDLSIRDLPAEVLVDIKNTYKSSTIEHLVLYFDTIGEISYFAEINLHGKCILLRVLPSGKMNVFSCISTQL